MSIDDVIAQRVVQLRTAQRLSLAQLADRSGVSKAMISRIERQDSSPTAAVLGRLAAGLGVSLTDLLDDGSASGTPALRKKAEQAVWRDPATGYVRRQVAQLDPASASELIEIELPAGAQVDYPQWHSKPHRQRLWILEGELELIHGESQHNMVAGDQLDFSVDKPITYIARTPCRYLLNILHERNNVA